MQIHGATFAITDTKLNIPVVNILTEDIVKLLDQGTTKKITSQEGGCLNFFKSLMSVVLPLMKNILKSLVKSVLVPSGLILAASATDAIVQKNGSGHPSDLALQTRTLVFSNEDLNDVMKIVKSLKESGLLIKGC